MFGEAVKLDAATIAKVKALRAGERLMLDRNNDGKPDECWFIDASPRHQKKVQPLLVRAIDEDSDMVADKGPDLDSDLYVADWTADGTVDAVIDYQDNDGDNDIDEMGIYFYSASEKLLDGKEALRCWWGCDDGDDNQLWYDVNYTYQQPACQWRSHFGGDETFVAFALGVESKEWLALFENPFLFYDHDKDDCSEEVIRISGLGGQVESLRYSFDADDDAYGRRAHDYEFSLTCLAPGSRWIEFSRANEKPPNGKKDSFNYLPGELVLPPAASTTISLRGIPTGPFLARRHAQRFCREATWARVLLTWDEMNANTEADVAGDPHERWEGLIARGSNDFPQIGGPPCSELNKRCELLDEPRQSLKLYYEPADRRLHLAALRRGWLHVDYDFDGKADANYLWIDEDRDKFIDRRQLDVDGDGKMDFDWRLPPDKRRQKMVDLDFKSISTLYKQALTEHLADSQHFITIAKAALAGQAVPSEPVEAFFLEKLESWMPSTGLGSWMRKSPGGARLYVDLVRDRLLLALKGRLGDRPAWAGIESHYAAGDFRGAAQRLASEMKASLSPAADVPFRNFARRIPLHLNNSGSPQRDDWPVCLSIRDLKAIAKDFNPENCAVVAAECWLDWRQVPHQVDQRDAPGGPELSFLADLPADCAITWYLYYSPTGETPTTFPAATGTDEDWVPPNIGWESSRIAYRAYYGQIDFFGKKTDTLIYGHLGNKSYHSEVEWGIDALNTYATSGCGGLTLYLGNHAYLVQNPINKGEIKFAKRQLTRGPVRAVVEVVATNIVPEHPDWSVRWRGFIYARRQETELRVMVTGPDDRKEMEEPVLGIGFTRLAPERVFADPKAGCFGIWGSQTPVIGEIGMSVIGPPATFLSQEDLPDEHRCKWRTSNGMLRYWLMADWRRGRTYPVAPTIDNWQQEVTGLAGLLLNDVVVKIGHPEDVEKAP